MITTAKVVGVLAAAAVAGTATVVTVVQTSADRSEAVVTHLVDGDTLDVSIGGGVERVRLLNVDTPETVDPDKPVQCLGPDASRFLADRIPVGTTVRVEYDIERTDRYGRTLAAVFAPDGGLVNADIARAGLGVALVVGGNDRFHPQVVAAQQEAAAQQRGMYSPDIACTVPGRTEALTTAVAALPAVVPTMSSSEPGGAADRAAAVVAMAGTFRSEFVAAPGDVVRVAFAPAELARIAAVVAQQHGAAQGREAELRTATAAAAVREATERARPETAPRSAPKPTPAPKPAPAPKPVPQPAPKPAPQPAPKPKPKPAPPARPSDQYPGYTGPRCYAPGGKTWKPC